MEIEGHSYVFQTRKRNGTRYLRCKFHSSHFCPGTAKQNPDGQFLPIVAHNHEVFLDVTAAFRRALTTRAAAEVTALKVIYDEETPRHPEAAVTYPYSVAEGTMRAARRRNLPVIPANLEELQHKLMGELAGKYVCCERHISRLVTGEDGSEAIVFFCQNLLDQAAAGLEELHIDATFKIVPQAPPTRQLLTVHGIVQNTSIPLVYALMNRQTKAAYDAVLRCVKHAAPTLEPHVIMTDFETALQQSAGEMWPRAEIKGCYFHFAQAIWKKNAKYNYLALINQNLEARKILRMLMGLALVPADRAREGFDLIKAYAREKRVDLSRTFNYFERFWLERVGPETFSVYSLPRRTNNNVEAFHNSLKVKFLPSRHPNIWHFMNDLVKCMKSDHTTLNQVRAGVTKIGRKTFLANDRRLRDAKGRLEVGQITLLEYLQRVSYSNAALEQRFRNWRNAVEHPSDEEDDDEFDPPNPAAEDDDLVDLPEIVRIVPIQGDAANIAGDNVNGNLDGQEEIIIVMDDEADIGAIDEPVQNQAADVVLNEENLVGLQIPNDDNPWRPQGGETESDNERETCRVCLIFKMRYVLTPCGHRFCGFCARRSYNPTRANSRCPMCRAMLLGDPIHYY